MLTSALLNCLRLLARHCAADTLERGAASIGVFAYHLGLRRAVVQGNLAQVFARQWSGPQRRRIGRRCYASMAATFVGLLHYGQRPDLARKRVELAAPQHLQQLVQRHPGAVWLTAHLGNWDLAGATIARVVGQCQVYATPQHDAVADAMINALRTALGLEVVLAAHGDRRGAVRVIKGLRAGRPVGLLADQGPPPSRGIGAWFLGQAVSCHRGPEFFARHLGVPVIPGIAVRLRAGRYRFYHGQTLWPTEFAEDALTQFGQDQLSALIAAVPGQYFWHHRRFKYRLAAPPRGECPWRQYGLDLWRGSVAESGAGPAGHRGKNPPRPLSQ